MKINEKISTYLIHGSLGSGKTTLVRNLLTSQMFKNSVVIENEYANFNLDEQTISQDNEIEIYGIAGGCICCSSGRELLDAFVEIAKAKPKTLIIETTGIASSVRLIQQLLLSEEFDQNFYLARNIFVIDALENSPKELKTYKALDIQLADIIIINKTDKVPATKTKEIKNVVKNLNINAKILTAIRAKIQPKDIYTNSTSQSSKNLIKHLDALEGILSGDHIESSSYIVVSPTKLIEIDSVNRFVKNLKAKGVVLDRIKGIFLTDNGAIKVEGTKNNIEYTSFNKQPKPGLVFIGKNLNKDDFKEFIAKYE